MVSAAVVNCQPGEEDLHSHNYLERVLRATRETFSLDGGHNLSQYTLKTDQQEMAMDCSLMDTRYTLFLPRNNHSPDHRNL